MSGTTDQEYSAHGFTRELCAGNADAEVFCTIWYRYCHAIDDILDTRMDGRPTMTIDAILETFALATLLYNCNFFIQNRHMLLGVALSVTNMYADSANWERDPEPHRRAMADTLRCCGDEMLLMVAFLIGGWPHMRKLSPAIRERDWLMQHDKDGNPI